MVELEALKIEEIIKRIKAVDNVKYESFDGEIDYHFPYLVGLNINFMHIYSVSEIDVLSSYTVTNILQSPSLFITVADDAMDMIYETAITMPENNNTNIYQFEIVKE